MNDVYKIYTSTFLMGIALAISVISTVYQLANGLSQTQIATISSLFFISYALLEIPTGGIADTYGHKKSVVWGLVAHGISILLIGILPDFRMFVISSLLAGLGYALQSGAYSSLIHDVLTNLNKSAYYIKVQGRVSAYLLFGTLVASPVVSYLYQYSSQLPYILSSVFLFLSAILVHSVKWKLRKDKPSLSLYFQSIKRGVQISLKNKRIIALIILGVVLFLGGNLFANNISQPLQLNLGIKIVQLGLVAAIISGAKAMTSAYAYTLYQKFGGLNSLIGSIIVTALIFFGLTQISGVFGIILILFLYIMAAYKDQIILTLLQNEASNPERSTIISTYSFLTFILVGLTMPLGGLSIDYLGVSTTLLIIAAITIMLGLFGLFIYSNNIKSSEGL